MLEALQCWTWYLVVVLDHVTLTTMDHTLNLVAQQNSADNAARQAAEAQFAAKVAANPSEAAYELISAAADRQLPEPLVQACLLHLKRLVPRFWLIGFELFTGPPVAEPVKKQVRESLLVLATQAALSKVRALAAYVIVQIAATDYPDEWPDLVLRLYAWAQDFDAPQAVAGALAVLTELFDDLISEEQFWTGGVGAELLPYVALLLAAPRVSPQVKLAGLRFYASMFPTLMAPEAIGDPGRRALVVLHVQELAQRLVALLEESVQSAHAAPAVLLPQTDLRSQLYRVVRQVFSTFAQVVPPATKQAVVRVAAADMAFAARWAKARAGDVPVETSEELQDPDQLATAHACDLMETLGTLQHPVAVSLVLLAAEMAAFAADVVQCCRLGADTVAEWDDFNVFVTETSGVLAQILVREAVLELAADVDRHDAAAVFAQLRFDQLPWELAEAHLFVAEALFSGDHPAFDGAVATLLGRFTLLLHAETHPLVVARVLMVLPRFFEHFSTKLDASSFAPGTLQAALACAQGMAGAPLGAVVQAAAVLNAPLWRNVPGLDLARLQPAQQALLETCVALFAAGAEEDTLPVLIEGIAVAVAMGRAEALATAVDGALVVEHVFKIAFKDPANVQSTIDAAECLQELLQDVPPEQYAHVCRCLVPPLMQVVSASLARTPVEYSPELYLALELLGHIVGAAPQTAAGDGFPPEMFAYTFPALKAMIMASSDDQILQNAGEVFNQMLARASGAFIAYTDEHKKTGLDHLLEVSSKFLSPELSDLAAMSCGLIVITLFEKFHAHLSNDFFYQLLQATVRRLLVSKEVVTTENLIMVFCKLVLNTSPEMLLDALTNMSVDGKTGLEAVLPIWFSMFEITRGFEKIQQNILALGKIYSLADPRVANMLVDGDLIPYDGDQIITRSMSKSMPQQYTQVLAAVKIVKLLVSELEFQCQQPDANDYLPEPAETDAADETGDWEDMDTIGVPTFDKLQLYVDSDDEEPAADPGIQDMLVQFFKECLAKNLGDFREYYDLLSDDEKTVITENVVF